MNSPGIQDAVQQVQQGTSVATNTPGYDQVMDDATKAYLASGGTQANVDAYKTQNPQQNPLKLAQDATNWYTGQGGADQDALNYFGIKPAPGQPQNQPITPAPTGIKEPPPPAKTAPPPAITPPVGPRGTLSNAQAPDPGFEAAKQQRLQNGSVALQQQNDALYGPGSGTIWDPWNQAPDPNAVQQHPGMYPGYATTQGQGGTYTSSRGDVINRPGPVQLTQWQGGQPPKPTPPITPPVTMPTINPNANPVTTAPPIPPSREQQLRERSAKAYSS